MISIRLV